MSAQKNKSNNTKRNLLALIVFAWMIIFIPTPGHAQLPVQPDSEETGMTVRYLGDAEAWMVIAVDYKNAEGNKCNLTLFNSEGDVLYKQNFSATVFNQKFKIQKTEELVKVVITDGDARKTFEVANTTKVLQDVLVKKVK